MRDESPPISHRGGHQGSRRGNYRGGRHNLGAGSNALSSAVAPTGLQSSPGHGPNRARTHPVRLPLNWMEQRSARFTLRNLPPNISTVDIWRSLHYFGEIVSIDLSDLQDGGGPQRRFARVLFSPPPTNTSFYHPESGKCKINIPGRGDTWVMASVDGGFDGNRTIKSPTGSDCPVDKVVNSTTVTFGFFLQPTVVMEKNTVVSGGQVGNIKLTVSFEYKKVTLELNMPLREEATGGVKAHKVQKCEMPFDALSRSKVYRIDLPKNRWALAIDLDDPPVWFRRKTNIEGTHRKDRNRWLAYQDSWVRLADVTIGDNAAFDTQFSLDVDPPNLDIGRWTTYWLEFENASKTEWLALENYLEDWNVKIILTTKLQLVPGVKPQLWSMLEDRVKSQPGQSSSEDLAMIYGNDRIHLPFAVRYQLEVCISQGVLNEYNITREFLEGLANLTDWKNKPTDKAKMLLEYASDKGKRVFDPMTLLDDKAALTFWPPSSAYISDRCALVKRAVITPTRIIFKTPTVEMTNRVLRRYKEADGYFLRLQFIDELHRGALRSGEGGQNDGLFSRMFQILRNGIWIGPWHWEFLAYGNSQIREGGVFVFCQPDGGAGQGVTRQKMIKWMGDFSHIKTVAKYAARIGQCFSTTRVVQGLHVPKLVRIPDVERNGHCFTDGIGKMSKFIASLISANWNLVDVPSAIQFRLAGCKGVIALWEDLEPYAVHIRKSQEKFTAEFQGLEIVRVSQFSIATLNRQSITILTSLGIDASIFVNMTKEQLHKYNQAMDPKNKALTIELLEKHVDENQITLTIASMVRNGFMGSGDPFVSGALHNWKIWTIRQLKAKARLVVEKSAFVLGCVDETGTLRGHSNDIEGRDNLQPDELPQIFLQIPDQDNPGQYKAITGICIVGRNPSLHPGDIRVLQAVDAPKLKHLKSVVVFPLTGDRDVPSMCSGGDLDGDDFFVMWDENLIPQPTEWGYPPMNYAAPAVEEETPTVDAMIQHFVLFMKNNVLPLIAHSHLAHADFHGAKSGKCLQLAQKHSMAVDYLKTGICAEYSQRDDNPRYWPHWMEKSPKQSRHSSSALGQMYDLIGHEDFKPDYKRPFDERILSRFPDLDADILQKARKLKSQYDTAMRRLMGQFEIHTEFEIWTTFPLSKPRVGSDYKLQETLGREVAALKQMWRDACKEEFGVEKSYDNDDKIDRFVAAMYQVTEEEVRIAVYEQEKPFMRKDGIVILRKIGKGFSTLMSFPWLFPDVLGRLATGSTANTSGPRSRRKEMQSFVDKKTLQKYVKDVEQNHGLEQELEPSQTREDIVTRSLEAPPGYTTTGDGLIIHRGEILNLFHAEDDDEDEEDSDHGIGRDATADQEVFLGLPTIPPQENVPLSPATSSNIISSVTVYETPGQGVVEDVHDVPDAGGLVNFKDSTESQEGGREVVETGDGVSSEDDIECIEEIALDIDIEEESALQRLGRLGA